LCGPNLMRIVLDPSVSGIALPDFLLGYGSDGAVLIEHDGAGAGGSFVESENAGHGSFELVYQGHTTRKNRLPLESGKVTGEAKGTAVQIVLELGTARLDVCCKSQSGHGQEIVTRLHW